MFFVSPLSWSKWDRGLSTIPTVTNPCHSGKFMNSGPQKSWPLLPCVSYGSRGHDLWRAVKWWAKQNLVFFFVNYCVCSIAKGEKWKDVEARGGARVFPGTFSDPLGLRAEANTHQFTKNSLDFVLPVTYGHCVTSLPIYLVAVLRGHRVG